MPRSLEERVMPCREPLNARDLPQRTLALLAGDHAAHDDASDVEALTA